jgi:hypothetical protein
LLENNFWPDDVTLTWASKNAVSCAVPVIDPSALAVPFSGHLPQGSIDVIVPPVAGVVSSSVNYWIVCADKDWNTTTDEVILQLNPPHLVDNPHPYEDDQSNKMLSIAFEGSPAIHLYCVNDYASQSEYPVNKIVFPDIGTNQANVSLGDLDGGIPLSCTADFGTVVEPGTFLSSGTTATFSVDVP